MGDSTFVRYRYAVGRRWALRAATEIRGRRRRRRREPFLSTGVAARKLIPPRKTEFIHTLLPHLSTQ